MSPPRKIVIVGAGINGLVAANYLRRAGCEVTVLERSDRVGGACVSETAVIDGIEQDFALGASTLGLMQDFVWRETGLADRLKIWAPDQPDLVYFPGSERPVRAFADPGALAREFAAHWDERGDVRAYQEDLEQVVGFLQAGYRAGRPPSLEDAEAQLGVKLTKLWISGNARDLLDHYFTAEQTKVYLSMDVTESGPVSLSESYSAFLIPMMSSGSIFGGDYGYVKGGIWKITEELDRINQELGVQVVLSCEAREVDMNARVVRYCGTSGANGLQFDHLLFATDPQTAARLSGDLSLIEATGIEKVIGTSGKLNLMFRAPVEWKHAGGSGIDTAFRYFFATETLAELEAATIAVTTGEVFAPGYFQVYCEGASMRQMGIDEPFERLAVFFKNLSLGPKGEKLPDVEEAVKALILSHIVNAEDCVWSQLLTPRDLQHRFGFPGGNIDHTALVAGQSFHERHYSANPGRRFYQFGPYENASICAAGSYPCGSVAGTPAYMCAHELTRSWSGGT